MKKRIEGVKKRIEGVTVYGIDIGKNSFHIVGLDSSGKPVLHSKFRRDRWPFPATTASESLPVDRSHCLHRRLTI